MYIEGLSFLFSLPILTTNRPTERGFYQAPIGSPCPDADKITDEATCRSAADVLVHTFEKTIDTTCNVGTEFETGQQRPNGCFHGKATTRTSTRTHAHTPRARTRTRTRMRIDTCPRAHAQSFDHSCYCGSLASEYYPLEFFINIICILSLLEANHASLYFNKHTGQESVKIASSGGMCKLGGGSTFIKVGTLGSAYGNANAVFQKHFWISIEDANNPRVKSFFAADLFPKGHTDDASYVPIGRSIWLMKDNAEHDLFGPFTINLVYKNDGCKSTGCTDGTTAMYFLQFASTTATTSNRERVQFSVGVRIFWFTFSLDNIHSVAVFLYLMR